MSQNKTQAQIDREYLQWFLDGAEEAARTPRRDETDDLYAEAYNKLATAQATLSGVKKKVENTSGKFSVLKFEDKFGKVPGWFSNVERLVHEAVELVDDQDDGTYDGREAVRLVVEKGERLLAEYQELLALMKHAEEVVATPRHLRGSGMGQMAQAFKNLG